MAQFRWTAKRQQVALKLAAGYTISETADECGVSSRSINRWKCDTEFAAEIDRLSLMVDIAGRAERVRLAMRVARRKVRDAAQADRDVSKLDLLYWLQYVQSETDGAKIDVASLLSALAQHAPPLAGRGQGRGGGDGEGDDTETE